MIRLALIGCGAWGWRYIPAALEAGNCVVTHVAGVGKSCPDEARQYLSGVQVVEAGTRALLALDVDAFVMASPPGEREYLCCSLLHHGRPVMIEKPLALSDEEAGHIVSAAWSVAVPLLVNHQHIFAPAYEALRAVVSSWNGKTILSVGEGPGPHRDYSALWDYGPHDVAMTLGLVPPGERIVPKWVREFRREGHGAGVDISSESATVTSLITASNCAPAKTRSLWVQSGDRTAHYDDLAEHKLRVDGHPVDISPERPLTLAVRAFAEAVRTGRTDWRFGRFGADVVGFLDQAQQLQDRQQEARDAHH